MNLGFAAGTSAGPPPPAAVVAATGGGLLPGKVTDDLEYPRADFIPSPHPPLPIIPSPWMGTDGGGRLTHQPAPESFGGMIPGPTVISEAPASLELDSLAFLLLEHL